MSIHAGRYQARGVAGSIQFGTSKNGAEQLGVDVEIVGGENEGARFTVILYFSEAAKPYSLAKLRALGWDGEDAEFSGIDSNEVTIAVKIEEYQGKEQTKVDILADGGGMKFKQTMDDAQKRMFLSGLGLKPKGGGDTKRRF